MTGEVPSDEGQIHDGPIQSLKRWICMEAFTHTGLCVKQAVRVRGGQVRHDTGRVSVRLFTVHR